jgi:hypothetical protein
VDKRIYIHFSFVNFHEISQDPLDEFLVCEKVRVSRNELNNEVGVGNGEKQMMNKCLSCCLLKFIRQYIRRGR